MEAFAGPLGVDLFKIHDSELLWIFEKYGHCFARTEQVQASAEPEG
ncbi:MAG: hypothetical protein RL215_1896, partial [Planctomycetota bacterium]